MSDDALLKVVERWVKLELIPAMKLLIEAAAVIKQIPEEPEAWLYLYSTASRFHSAAISMTGYSPVLETSILEYFRIASDQLGAPHFGQLCQCAFDLFKPGEPRDVAGARERILRQVRDNEWPEAQV